MSRNNAQRINTSRKTPFAVLSMPLWLMIVFLVGVFFVAQPMDFFWATRRNYSLDAYLSSVTHGDIWRQVVLGILGFWAVVEHMANARKLRVNGTLGWLCLAFLSLTILSISWADDQLLSAKRVAVLMILALSALAVAERVTFEDITTLVFWGCGITVALGWCAEMAQGIFNPLGDTYRFAGTMHPNNQGWYSGFLSIAGISLAQSAKRHKHLFALGATMGFAFLFLTKSRTSVAACLVSIGLYAAITSRRPIYRIVSVAWIAVVIGLTYVLLDIEGTNKLGNVVLMGRGEDVYTPTLMGRTDLWKVLLNYIYEHPVLGYGYGSFWTPRRISTITENQGWLFGSAHSGYLEMALGVGLLGAGIYVAILVKGLAESVAFYRRGQGVGFAFGAIAITFVLIVMLLASVPLESNLMIFSCMVIVAKLGFLQTRDNYNRVPNASMQHGLHLREKATDAATGRVL